MATTRKIERKAGLRLESGKAIGSGWAYGGSTIISLGAAVGLPYETISVKGVSETVEDNSVEGAAFKPLPVQVGKFALIDGWSGNMRYRGMDRFLYWGAGYEDGGGSPIQQFIFTVSGVSTSPAVGDTYTNNSSTFTIRQVDITSGSGTLRGERTTGSNDPDASGDLTRATGSGDATIAFSSRDLTYYSHLYELDKHERHFTPYRTAEQTAGDYHADDRKNRYAAIGIAEGPNDHRYSFAACTGFGFSSKAGDVCKWSASALAYQEERGSYLGSLTYGTGVTGSTNLVGHHHLTASLYNGASYTELGLSEFNVEVVIPLKRDQDSESGLNINKPVLGGQYQVNASIVIARHDEDTWLAMRDNFTATYMKLMMTTGHYRFDIFLPNIALVDTEVAEADVPTHPITFAVGEPDSNPFSAEIGSHTLIQEGKIFFRTINKNSTNEMRRET